MTDFSSFINKKKQLHGDLRSKYSIEQSAVINAAHGSNGVIVACPGAGKTKVLLDRVANLIKAGARPDNIALLTFTREAARQFEDRLKANGLKSTPLCSTVHSLAYKLVLDIQGSVSLIDDNDLQVILQRVRTIDEYLMELSDKEILLEINKRRESFDATGWAEIVKAYEEELVALNKHDFTSILKIAAKFASPLYKYVYVDEFQDLSDLQYEFISKIGKTYHWFVGDPDQAIYSFKGSSDRVLKNLTNGAYPVYFLTKNYRGSPEIVSCANNVICHNRGFRKPISSATPHKGEVRYMEFEFFEQEMKACKEWQADKPDSIALVRTNRLKEAFISAGIKVLTVHESKGLEWENVWVAACEEGTFPHVMNEVQEERRLFYVAITRAKRVLVVSYSKNRKSLKGEQVKTKSRFVEESRTFEESLNLQDLTDDWI